MKAATLQSEKMLKELKKKEQDLFTTCSLFYFVIAFFSFELCFEMLSISCKRDSSFVQMSNDVIIEMFLSFLLNIRNHSKLVR